MKSPLSQSPIKKGNQKPGNLIRKGKGVGDGAQMLKNGDGNMMMMAATINSMVE